MTCRIRATIAFGGLLVVTLAAPGEATAGTESFSRSCSEVRSVLVKGRLVISANCNDGRTTDKFAGFTALPTRLVVPPEGCGDIANIRGQLRCIGTDQPGGSWSASCRDGRYLRGRTMFSAVCRSITGAGNGTQIDMRTCPSGRLRNLNAHLRCE